MIEVHDAVYCYPNDSAPAVRNVSLSVEPGEMVGIVGPNGSGKSTLARLIKGLLLPQSGSVVVDGLDTRTEAFEVRRHVGLVFQNPSSQIVNAVVEQEIAFGPENLALPPDDIRRRVDEALVAVDLVQSAGAETHALSMAGKQRVALASVLAMRPRYLVLDEPTAWLEPSSRWQLFDRVLRWSAEANAGIVLVTHRMDEALLCDRLLGMLDGRIEIEGPAAEVLSSELAGKRLKLEVPDTVRVAETLQRAGVPVTPGSGVAGLAEVICPS